MRTRPFVLKLYDIEDEYYQNMPDDEYEEPYIVVYPNTFDNSDDDTIFIVEHGFWYSA